MKFQVYQRRFHSELIAIGERGVPGRIMKDEMYPAFDLGALRHAECIQDCRRWVSSSDWRWAEWDVCMDRERINFLLAQLGGREGLESLLDNMIQERLKELEKEEEKA